MWGCLSRTRECWRRGRGGSCRGRWGGGGGGGRVRLWDRTPVRRVDLEGTRPTVVTERGRIECERLIVTAGPWTGQLMAELAGRLTVTRAQGGDFRPGGLG